jgi:putative phosphoesterase
MRIAVIGDIHGNMYALNSVLKDIDHRDVDTILSTGDLIGYFPYPNEVIELIKKYKILSIQGNHDELFSNSEPVYEEDFIHLPIEEKQANASRLYTNYVLTSKNREFIKSLPKHLKLEFNGSTLIIVHGSPRSNKEYMLENSDYLTDIANEREETIIISGHTHIPYYKEINNKHIINAGSVGKPKHGNKNATYIILDLNEHKVNVEIIEVEYDVEQLVKDIEANEMISNKLIDNLRNGY